MLKRYAFSACLDADGIKAIAVSHSLSFLTEASKAPFWKFPQLTECARTYVRSRASSLTTNLGIEKCLDFMESPQLDAAIAAKEGTGLSCASTHQVVESGPPPTLD